MLMNNDYIDKYFARTTNAMYSAFNIFYKAQITSNRVFVVNYFQDMYADR